MTNLGQAGEELVARDYESKGYKLLEKNYIFPRGLRMGEIDLILEKDQELVFVEVKSRRSTQFGSPFEAVDFHKQRKLVKTAKLYLQLHPKFRGWNYRIDVAGVDIDNPNQSVIIIMNAIEDLD